jgi:hypothetical protein
MAVGNPPVLAELERVVINARRAHPVELKGVEGKLYLIDVATEEPFDWERAPLVDLRLFEDAQDAIGMLWALWRQAATELEALKATTPAPAAPAPNGIQRVTYTETVPTNAPVTRHPELNALLNEGYREVALQFMLVDSKTQQMTVHLEKKPSHFDTPTRRAKQSVQAEADAVVRNAFRATSAAPLDELRDGENVMDWCMRHGAPVSIMAMLGEAERIVAAHTGYQEAAPAPSVSISIPRG